MGRFRHYPSIVIVLLLTVFVTQNVASVELQLLFWAFEAPRALVLVAVFLAGVVVGLLQRKGPRHIFRK